MQLPLLLEGKKSGGQGATLEREAELVYQEDNPYQPPSSLPWRLLEAQHSRARSWHLSPQPGAGPAVAGCPTPSVPSQENVPPRVNQAQAQGPTLLLQLESLLCPQLPLLDLLLVSPPRKEARLRPAPVWQGQQCSH